MSDGAACCFQDESLVYHRSEHWSAALAWDQRLLGRSIVYLHRHAETLDALAHEEREDMWRTLDLVHAGLRGATSPAHFNVLQLGNWERHLHLHVLPRYEQEVSYGGHTFRDEQWNNPPDMFSPHERLPHDLELSIRDLLAASVRRAERGT
jgi:diadenosine tetraphosphate (Ap4A) HIT family hydrolase